MSHEERALRSAQKKRGMKQDPHTYSMGGYQTAQAKTRHMAD